MLRILFEWFEFALEWFESLSNGSKLNSNVSQIVGMRIRMLRIPFEWFEFPLECYESLSNGSNVHSSASNPFRMVEIWFRKL